MFQAILSLVLCGTCCGTRCGTPCGEMTDILCSGARREGRAADHEAGGPHQAAHQGAEERQGGAGAGEEAAEGAERHHQGALEGDPGPAGPAGGGRGWPRQEAGERQEICS